MSWDYELAKELRGIQTDRRPELTEGEVVSVSPLTVSLYGGEVMAPPVGLGTIAGFSWYKGDRLLCAWLGKSVVILGRLSGP